MLSPSHTGSLTESLIVISPKCLEATGRVQILLLLFLLLKATDKSCLFPSLAGNCLGVGIGRCIVSPVPVSLNDRLLSALVRSPEAA